MAEEPSQATASNASKDTTGKPAILIVGGLGLFPKTLSDLSTFDGAEIQATLDVSSPFISTRTILPPKFAL